MSRAPSCICGSGLPKTAQFDARGIFLTSTCARCHARRMQEFREDVLTDANYWADEPIESDD